MDYSEILASDHYKFSKNLVDSLKLSRMNQPRSETSYIKKGWRPKKTYLGADTPNCNSTHVLPAK